MIYFEGTVHRLTQIKRVPETNTETKKESQQDRRTQRHLKGQKNGQRDRLNPAESVNRLLVCFQKIKRSSSECIVSKAIYSRPRATRCTKQLQLELDHNLIVTEDNRVQADTEMLTKWSTLKPQNNYTQFNMLIHNLIVIFIIVINHSINQSINIRLFKDQNDTAAFSHHILVTTMVTSSSSSSSLSSIIIYYYYSRLFIWKYNRRTEKCPHMCQWAQERAVNRREHITHPLSTFCHTLIDSFHFSCVALLFLFHRQISNCF